MRRVLLLLAAAIAGNGGITRLDVPAFTATAILPPGEFSLTAISPSKTRALSVAGLRNSDGKQLRGDRGLREHETRSRSSMRSNTSRRHSA